jgi:hypothetical protein
MKSNLGKVFEVLEGEIPKDFISIANTQQEMRFY